MTKIDRYMQWKPTIAISWLIDRNCQIRQIILINQDDCKDSIDELMIDHCIVND